GSKQRSQISFGQWLTFRFGRKRRGDENRTRLTPLVRWLSQKGMAWTRWACSAAGALGVTAANGRACSENKTRYRALPRPVERVQPEYSPRSDPSRQECGPAMDRARCAG